MKIIFTQDSVLNDLNQQFQKYYKFLKLQFYSNNVSADHNKEIPGDAIKDLSITVHDLIHGRIEATIDMSENCQVKAFEKSWFDTAGIWCQVFRKSGNVWLQTTVTDDMSLKEVNSFGEEMSTSIEKPEPDDYHEQV